MLIERVLMFQFLYHVMYLSLGDVSAGWVYPSKIQADKSDLKRWFDLTFSHFSLLNKNFSSSETGVAPISGFVFNPPDWTLATCSMWMRQMKQEEIDAFVAFKTNQSHEEVYRFDTWTCDCLVYLPWLTKKITEKGGNFIQGRILNLKELSNYDVIVNCSGLGSRELVPDPNVYPVKGQVYTVKAPWIKHFYEFEDSLYVLPKLNEVIVGGTKDKYDTSWEVNQDESKRIWKQCCERLPSLRTAKIIQEKVGFRPTRDPVLLKMESSTKVVHCYGHGGSGVTLSWGCAVEVSELVAQLLRDAESKSKL